MVMGSQLAPRLRRRYAPLRGVPAGGRRANSPGPGRGDREGAPCGEKTDPRRAIVPFAAGIPSTQSLSSMLNVFFSGLTVYFRPEVAIWAYFAGTLSLPAL